MGWKFTASSLGKLPHKFRHKNESPKCLSFCKEKFWHSTLYGIGKCKNHGIEEGREIKGEIIFSITKKTPITI